MNQVSVLVVLGITITGLLLGHLLPFGEHSLLLQNLRNALHGPVFLLASLIIWRAIQHRFSTPGTILVSGATVVAVAIGGETLQMANGYPFSFRDIGFDLMGAATALLFLSGSAASRGLILQPDASKFLKTSASFILIALMLPVGWWSLTILGRDMHMPQLMNDRFPLWRNTVEARDSTIDLVQPPAGWPAGHARALRVETGAARYAGIAIPDPFPDWRGFSSLTFLAASGDGRERRLTLRVHDDAHDQSYTDRFNRSWHLGRPVINGRRSGIDEPRRFCIPLAEIADAPAGRKMDLGSISALAIFVTDANAGESFFLGDMRLERSPDESCKQ